MFFQNINMLWILAGVAGRTLICVNLRRIARVPLEVFPVSVTASTRPGRGGRRAHDRPVPGRPWRPRRSPPGTQREKRLAFLAS
ncbi:hypothetical protein APA44_33110 [Pseudomonas aeruginosa]|nr:hypothetical protein BH596_20265 [Pseudomonas aeruginosa]OPD67105.1 hypothetical protein AO882_32630 [Pseudomonas paraeruginosa]OPE06942.1 hypothetical protein APA44_33110 [Pseudomonas aeruginosa]HBP5362870.1 hypothetical protein [Pseudomonas aeruginosa]HBP6378719.1 hypothetical protein [Pseudomonas aeruginosa]